MTKISGERTIIVIFVVVILVVLGCGVAAYKIYQPGPFLEKPISSENDFQGNVSYIINYGDGDIREYKIAVSDDSTVFSLLEELAERENFNIETEVYPEMGVFVKSIGEAQGGTDNKWWQYWVNGALGETAADKNQVKAGDVVEWKFEIPSF